MPARRTQGKPFRAAHQRAMPATPDSTEGDGTCPTCGGRVWLNTKGLPKAHAVGGGSSRGKNAIPCYPIAKKGI